MVKSLTKESCAGLLSTIALLSTMALAASPPPSKPKARPATADADGAAEFHRYIQPLLKKYCYDCHSGEAKSGNVTFDEHKAYAALTQDHKLFGKVFKNLRSGTMPPADMPQPTPAEKERIDRWIKSYVYRINPASPDPGRVTLRRLNRVEYRNTILDLTGVDYDTQTEFPPDDAGHGFDNIADALTLSPLLLEKYLNAAQAIVARAVPTTSKVEAEKEIPGKSFQVKGMEGETSPAAAATADSFRSLSYYDPANVSHSLSVDQAGRYQLVLDLSANEKYVDNQFDYNRCRLIFLANGKELFRKEFNREGGKPLHYTFDQSLPAGPLKLSFQVQPLTPGVEQIRSLTLRINKVTVRGPYGAQYQVQPRNYRTFFPRPVPAGASERRDYARQILGDFARQAFRRPVDKQTQDRLVALAEDGYIRQGQTFEAGVSEAMVAILSSPRFLFREEGVVARQDNKPYALVDEYALASRLSYFLWSSMPDKELFQLASEKNLRKSLDAQVQRMLRDARSEALTRNFSGQWLQTRDIETVPINAFAVMRREMDIPAVAPIPAGRTGTDTPSAVSSPCCP